MATADYAEADKADRKADVARLKKVIDDLQTKDDTRRLMPQMWLDSDQYPKAIEYWEGLLKDKPSAADVIRSPVIRLLGPAIVAVAAPVSSPWRSWTWRCC